MRGSADNGHIEREPADVPEALGKAREAVR